jgi:hypothetical protein
MRKETLPWSFCSSTASGSNSNALIEMPSEQSNSASYRARAAICAQCAKQAISPEAAAALLYLEEMWLVIAEVADVNVRSGSRHALGSDTYCSLPE